MTKYRVLVDGEAIADNVRVADNFFTRLKGLQKAKTMCDGEGLLIKPCCQVHTFNMNFNIDVLFISRSGEILMILDSMLPGQISPFVKNCHQVLELKDGTVRKRGIITGQRVAFDIVN